jgi:hypothetical protein
LLPTVSDDRAVGPRYPEEIRLSLSRGEKVAEVFCSLKLLPQLLGSRVVRLLRFKVAFEELSIGLGPESQL